MNNTARIKNSQGQWATIWPISEHFYSLQYDGEKETVTITNGQLEVLKKYSHAVSETDDFGNVRIKDNGKLKLNEYGEYSVEYPRGLPDVPFDAYTTKLHQGESVTTESKLPTTFKFYYLHDTELIYTYTNHNESDRAEISWKDRSDDSLQKTSYYVGAVRKHIAEGAWIVLPEEKKSYISSISYQINVDASEAQKQLAETIALAERLGEAKKALGKSMNFGDVGIKLNINNTMLGVTADNLLDTIKVFTSGTGHDVFISEGIYKVYRKDEDLPYVCNSDEQVVAVMDALKTLDEAGKEGEGRFFTLDIEGIV